MPNSFYEVVPCYTPLSNVKGSRLLYVLWKIWCCQLFKF